MEKMKPPSSGSALTNNLAFKLVNVRHGSGREAIHIALDQWIRYPSAPDEIVLTIDAESYVEFERQVSILKETLDNLKPIAKEVFRQIDEDRRRK